MKKLFILLSIFIVTQAQAGFTRKAALYAATAAYGVTLYPALKLSAFLAHGASDGNYEIEVSSKNATPKQMETLNGIAKDVSRYGQFTNTNGPIGLLLAPAAFWTLVGHQAYRANVSK